MTRLMLFPPSPFFFCCLYPHAHLEAPNMASFEDVFPVIHVALSLSQFHTCYITGSCSWLQSAWRCRTINSQQRENSCGRLLPFWMHFLSHSHLSFGKATNKWLPEWIQRVFCNRVDLSFSYSFLEQSIIPSLLKPRTGCQTKANSRLWEKFLSQLHKCGSGGTPVIKQSIK